MVARRLPVAAVLAAAALVLAGSPAGFGSPAPQAIYRLRADPRMCPSPMCGGFWASLVNRKLATCLDGTQAPACYAGMVDLSALPRPAQDRVRPQLSTGRALVAGSLVRYPGDEFPQLARLVGVRVWLAAGTKPDAGTVYRVVDTGIRCVRAPCFSLRATVVNGTRAVTLSSLDLEGSGAPPRAIDAARAALSRGGILVSGPVRASADGGRTLVATQLWLSA